MMLVMTGHRFDSGHQLQILNGLAAISVAAFSQYGGWYGTEVGASTGAK